MKQGTSGGIWQKPPAPVFTIDQGQPLAIRTINYITQEAGERTEMANPNPRLKYINPHIFRHFLY